MISESVVVAVWNLEYTSMLLEMLLKASYVVLATVEAPIPVNDER